MKDMREELLTKEPVALMIKLCVPAVLGMLVIGLYSFVDAIYAGQMIGTNAMGAVSVAYPFTLINSRRLRNAATRRNAGYFFSKIK
ncbi:Na+-driven multidrug efflux pump [Clostridium beijerinckii]|nr:Na+-driven multidrug efflux pump [Clostridium beijerinckii]